MPEQFAPEGWTLWCGPIWEQLLKSCCLWEASVGLVHEGQHPMGGISCWNSCQEWPQRSSTVKVLWTDCNHHFPTSVRDVGKGRWKEGIFSLLLVLTAVACYEQAINYINLPYVESVLPMTVIGEQFPSPYLNPWAFFSVDFSLILLRRSERAARWCLAAYQLNHHIITLAPS